MKLKKLIPIIGLCLLLITGAVLATITSETTRVSYSGNGSTTVFAYPFTIIADADLLVIIRDASGNETTQTLTTHYTVSGAGVDGGGNVTMVTAPTSTETLLIMRNRALKQESDWITGGGFLAETLEDDIDELTMIAQQQEEKLGRALLLKKTSSYSDLDLPNIVAGQILGWNSSGDGVANYPPGGSTVAVGTIDYIGNYSNSLSTAITSIGSTKTTLIINTDVTQTQANVIPSTLQLFFLREGKVTLGAFNLTINGPMSGPNSQRFDDSGAGSVSFGLGSVKEVYPEWWGNNTTPGTTDMNAEIQSAINAVTSGGVGIIPVSLPPEVLMFSNLTLPPRLGMYGQGMWQTQLKRISGSTGNAIEDNGSANKIILHDFSIYGNSTTGTGIELGKNTTQWGQGYLHNIHIRDIDIGFDLSVNVAEIGRIDTQDTTTAGIKLVGSSLSIQDITITGVSNITRGMDVGASEVVVMFAHMEGKFTNPYYISAGDALFLRAQVSVSASTTITDAFYITAGDLGSRVINFIGLTAKAGAVITNFMNDQQNSVTIPYVAAQTPQSYDQEDRIRTLADEATPSILTGKKFLTGGTTTITDFDDGYTGKEIIVISEHSLDITDGTNIFLSGSANWSMTATDTLTLIQKADGKWYELSRSDSGA
jgi:hypothetical protein